MPSGVVSGKRGDAVVGNSIRTADLGSALESVYSSVRPVGEVFPELVGVNLHYVENDGQGVNANYASCANAAHDRLIGRNEGAVASSSSGYASENYLLSSAPYGFKSVSTPAVVIEEMKRAGDGAARPLIIKQPGGVDHVISVVNKAREIYFVDAQAGKIVVLQSHVPVRLGAESWRATDL